MSENSKKLLEVILIQFDLKLLTGMRIGGGDPGIAIGAVDAPVIRDPVSQEPYIPGSSLKGKLRSCFERLTGQFEVSDTGVASPGIKKDWITTELFGAAADQNKPYLHSSRLIVRDAFLTRESVELLDQHRNNLDGRFTEIKVENSIDRLTGGVSKSGGLRSFERVPRGVSFQCNLVLYVYEDESRSNFLEALHKSLFLLQAEYIGGSGSRGYGQVMVTNGHLSIINLTDPGFIPNTLDWDSAFGTLKTFHSDSELTALAESNSA